MPANARPSPLSMIFRSYYADLRQWFGGLATRYALACGLMLAGAIALVVAVAVGVAAAFHGIEQRYGVWIAYAAIGGTFLMLGIVGLVVGRVLIKRPAPAVPRPSRQVDMLKRAIAMPVATRLISTSRSGAGLNADAKTQALAAAAAVMLVGWVAASRFRRKPDAIED